MTHKTSFMILFCNYKKPIILLFGLSLLILGCSDGSIDPKKDRLQFISKHSPDEILKAKKLFVDMMNTADYSSYKNALNTFVYKMDGNAILFTTKEKYMNWISENLSKSKFSSQEEFSTLLDDMVAKHSTLISENPELFLLMDTADEAELLEIIQPSLGTPPVTSMSNLCADGCMNDCENAINGNDWAYSLDYGTGSHSFAQQYYWVRYKSIINSFNDCLSSC